MGTKAAVFKMTLNRKDSSSELHISPIPGRTDHLEGYFECNEGFTMRSKQTDRKRKMLYIALTTVLLSLLNKHVTDR